MFKVNVNGKCIVLHFLVSGYHPSIKDAFMDTFTGVFALSPLVLNVILGHYLALKFSLPLEHAVWLGFANVENCACLLCCFTLFILVCILIVHAKYLPEIQ